MNAQTLVPAAGGSFPGSYRTPDASVIDMAATEFHVFLDAMTPASGPAQERTFDHEPSYARSAEPELSLPAPRPS